MKKSFWGVMLTLAALVMMLGASSAAFAKSSADIVLSFDVGVFKENLKSLTTVTLTSAISVDGTGIDKVSVNKEASKDVAITVTSVDKNGNWTLNFIVELVSLDSNKFEVNKGKNSVDVVSAEIRGTNVSASIRNTTKLTNVNRGTGHTPSFDIIISKDVKPFNIVFLVAISDDTKSGDFAFGVQVSPTYPTAAGGKAFVSADFALTVDTDLGTVTPATFTLTPTSKSQTVTVDEGLAGETISFDISSDVKLLKVTTGTIVSSTDKTAKVTVIAPAEDSTDVTFKFASGDENGSFDVTVKLVISSDSSIITEDSDYGSFTLTPANATSTTAVSVVSTDYKGKLCASADATATALTKSGSFTAEDVTTFTLTFKATDGEDGSISIADVYDVSDTTDIFSVSDDLSNDVFTPGQASSYRILFKATPEDETADAEYFTVNFSLAESGSSTEDATTKKEYNNAADGTVDVSDLSTTEISNLNSAYGVDITNLPKDSSGRARAFLMQLPAAPAVGDVIRIKFVPSSNGTPNFTSTGIETGYFKAKLAHPVIVVTCYGLVDSSTTSTLGSDPLYFDPGTYVVLARNFTVNSTSVGSFNTAADETDAKLEEDTYAGNEEPLGSNKGSSSGCDAGFGALALLALALPLVKKFSK